MRMKTLSVSLAVFATPLSHDTRVLPSEPPIRSESRIWFTGSSNIRRFTCKAGHLTGSLDLRGIPTTSPLLVGENATTLPSVTVTVDSLDCGIGVMNHHLHDTLLGRQHPRIDFQLTTYDVDLRQTVPLARIAGFLTVAGVQRPVVTTATIHEDSLGRLHVRGVYGARPSEFGVVPPRRFGGLLRVRDRAAVHFDVALDPDGGAIDTIASRLRSVTAGFTREAYHVSPQ